YDVVRSGVDPLVARITLVVPVAETGEGVGMRSKATPPEKTSVPQAAHTPISHTPRVSRGGRE
ncbi:MAG TPA: hypothetical protein VJQ25_02650, partial [Nitrospira sp.]|nr:hypothetical protein [Nitrospira sp.]